MALTFAAPAQAEAPTPLEYFTAFRATSICLIEHGIGTFKQVTAAERSHFLKKGLTLSQYNTFNRQAGRDEWVGKLVKEYISSHGGCARLLAYVKSQKDPL